MLLTEYLSNLVKVIEEYSKTGLIIDSELTTDFAMIMPNISRPLTPLDTNTCMMEKYLLQSLHH